ncbi:hypothetical protein SAMN05192533_10513 [Mesobacillus persicus]|uniref:RES domain-containing protein n=1 Tax=Mesobacillus persicus TaxID=930146 RepID=A0A1H8AJR4_9BACI|nr:hypothetical protein [Mesobacillus persicus]SEM70098.1 hypothetical protein SAMN05192533_10513 [Mesobacillus persicus]
MKRTAYRGVSFNEAQAVVQNQWYERTESRDFLNGVAARSSFGQGLYLVNDQVLAARYAFCHAEVEKDEQAVILKQKIHLNNPFILNYKYSETRLRKDALNWKFDQIAFPYSEEDETTENSLEISRKIGEVIMEYLLHHSYDGIIYHINDEIIYYVLYDQAHQVEKIEVELVFNIHELNQQPS